AVLRAVRAHPLEDGAAVVHHVAHDVERRVLPADDLAVRPDPLGGRESAHASLPIQAIWPRRCAPTFSTWCALCSPRMPSNSLKPAFASPIQRRAKRPDVMSSRTSFIAARLPALITRSPAT